MDWEEARSHAGSLIAGGSAPAWIEDRAQQIIPHYIWTWQEGRKKSGLCTACRHVFDRLDRDVIHRPDEYEYEEEFLGAASLQYFREHWTGGPRHKSTGLCPHCGAWVEFRSLAKGKNSLEDKLFFVVYARSAADKDAVVCVGYRIFIPWRDMDDFEFQPPVSITPMEVCVFRWGQGGRRFIRETGWEYVESLKNGRERWQKYAKGTWTRRRDCLSGYTGQKAVFGNDQTQVVTDMQSLRDAVRGTLWQYCRDHLPYTDVSNWNDQITLMDRICRYPCVEYLLKMGMSELAKLVIDRKGNGLLNLRGKTARSVLRLDKEEWGWVKGNKVRLTEDMLELMAQRRTGRLRISLDLCRRISQMRDAGSVSRMRADFPGMDVAAACKYAYRQHARLGDYLDYLRQCRLLGADLTSRQVLWPTDLHEKHERYTVQLRQLEEERREAMRRANRAERTHMQLEDAEKDKTLPQLLRKRCAALMPGYTFRACGLVLSPFETAQEIIREGMEQDICIGDYVMRYATGGTILCKLRREDELDKPFHAVEFSAVSGAMIQCRGRGNKTDDTDEQLIRAFWAAWDAARGCESTVPLLIRETKKKEAAA